MPAAPPTAPKPRPSWWSRVEDWFGRGPRFPTAGAASAPAAAAGAGGPSTVSGTASRPGERQLPKLSDYRLEQIVARTDRRTVYRAVENANGHLIALKTVLLAPGISASDRAKWRERFLHDAEAASKLRHPDIVRVRAGGVQGDGDATTGWLALEWVPGADLSRYTTPTRLLPERLVLTIASRVALALEHAHKHGIVHRDIKPGNVMYDPASNSVKVTDFGSARVADSEATRSGMIMGTPAYMAPEQLAGAEATPQSDLYSVGVMLFELLTGRRPFDAPSMGELLSRIAHQDVPRVTEARQDLPPLVDDIVTRLLSKSPEDRHKSGRQLALELQVAMATLAPDLPEPPSSSPAVMTLAPFEGDQEDPGYDTVPMPLETRIGARSEAQSTEPSSLPSESSSHPSS